MGKGTRHISDEFLESLKNDNGIKKLITIIKEDIDLCFELRDSKAELYYRGKKLFDIRMKNNKILFYFNKNLKPVETKVDVTIAVNSSVVCAKINDYKKLADKSLDNKNREYNEGRFQYRLAHCNGICHTEKNPFLVVDIEYYQESKNDWHFDLVALDSEGSQPFFSFIEVKYGKNSLRTKEGKNSNPGILKHLLDFSRVSDTKQFMDIMKKDLEIVISQKVKLGLTDSDKKMDIDNTNTEFLFIIFDYEFSSKQLKYELNEIWENHKDLYDKCKNKTFFAFIESSDDIDMYKIKKNELLSFEIVMEKYSSSKNRIKHKLVGSEK